MIQKDELSITITTLHLAQQNFINRNNRGQVDFNHAGIPADVCYRLPSMEIAARHSDTSATIRTLGQGVAFCEKCATSLSY